MKTWGRIKTETLNLGFEKTKAYDKNKQSYIDAYNWAVNFLNNTIAPVTELLFLNVDFSSNNGIYDLVEYEDTFAGIVDVVYRDDYSRVDCQFIADQYLVLTKQSDGREVIVIYKQYVPLLTVTDSDDFKCPIKQKFADLIPYLMANRLYLDDDASKAGYYWNLYDDMKNSIINADNKPLATVRTEDIITDEWAVFVNG